MIIEKLASKELDNAAILAIILSQLTFALSPKINGGLKTKNIL